MTLAQIFKDLNPKWIDTSEQYRMMCPFREKHDASNDGSNSFFITPNINAYHCFSCKSHGNLVALMTTRFEVPFSDAIELVSLENIDKILNPKERLGTEVDQVIPMTPPPDFVKRGFTPRLLKKFGVGYEVNERGQAQIFQPVKDNDGSKVAGIKCRVGRSFWYIPKSFPKENYLYNYYRARKYRECILVEGETDVYQSCRHGLWNVVAHMGGSLSEQQADLMKIFDVVYLAEDNDKQGTKNIEIAYQQLCTLGPEIKVMLYDADDPGSCGKDEWLWAYDNAIAYEEYRVKMAFEFEDDYMGLLKYYKSK